MGRGHLTKLYFSILFKTSFESSWETPGHPGAGGDLYKIGPNKFMCGRGCVGEAGVCGGIDGGKVRFVWYAFFTIKNAHLLNFKKSAGTTPTYTYKVQNPKDGHC